MIVIRRIQPGEEGDEGDVDDEYQYVFHKRISIIDQRLSCCQ